MVSQMTGMATTTIHAPLANLLISTMTRTTPVKHAPTVLMARDRTIRRRAALPGPAASSRFQCRIIPVWLHTNETNTPMMYSWMSRVGDAWKTTMSRMANPLNSKIPLLNASRSPRVCSWRGRYPSRDRIEASTGNPLNAVLAASTRISAVTNCRM